MATVAKKRIGNTLIIRWQVTTDGEDIPFDGRRLELRLVDPIGDSQPLPFTFEAGTNVAEFIYQGKNQKRTGFYTVEMWENRGEDMQAVVDRTEAFELVKHTKDEGGA